MKRVLIILAIFVISNIDLYSQAPLYDFVLPEFPNEEQQRMIDKFNANRDDYTLRLYRIVRGSEDPADIALVEGSAEHFFCLCHNNDICSGQRGMEMVI